MTAGTDQRAILERERGDLALRVQDGDAAAAGDLTRIEEEIDAHHREQERVRLAAEARQKRTERQREDAYVHIGLGEHDEAIRCLEQSYEEREGQLPDIHAWIPFDPLRADPRFQALLRRMNFPE